MTDDPDPTVAHGEEGPSGDRQDKNHGAVKNGLSDPSNFPSAPPSCFALARFAGQVR